jgi:ankyrin repeat protein
MRYVLFLLALFVFPPFADADPILDESLCTAAKAGATDQIHLLLTQGANANAACKSGDQTMGPLILAVKADRADAVAILLGGGAQIDSADSKYGLSAIFGTKSADVGKILLDHGASLTTRDKRGGTPFDWLSARVNDATFPAVRAEPVAVLFLERGADIDDLAEPGDQSPLMTACVLQQRDYVAFLIAHHANVNLRNHAGDTALALVVRTEGVVRPEFAQAYRDLETLLRSNGAQL